MVLFMWYAGKIPAFCSSEPISSGLHFTLRICTVLPDGSPSFSAGISVSSPYHLPFSLCRRTAASGVLFHRYSGVVPKFSAA